jgi:hypothetical protein
MISYLQKNILLYVAYNKRVKENKTNPTKIRENDPDLICFIGTLLMEFTPPIPFILLTVKKKECHCGIIKNV